MGLKLGPKEDKCCNAVLLRSGHDFEKEPSTRLISPISSFTDSDPDPSLLETLSRIDDGVEPWGLINEEKGSFLLLQSQFSRELQGQMLRHCVTGGRERKTSGLHLQTFGWILMKFWRASYSVRPHVTMKRKLTDWSHFSVFLL